MTFFMRPHGAGNGACAFGLVALLCSGCSPDFKKSPAGPPIGVSMTVATLSTNDCVVTVTLVNKGATTLEFDENDLPWHIAGDAVTLALVEEDGLLKDPIPRIPAILDSVVAFPLVLKPGEVRSQEVHLDRYYSTLPSALLRHDVTMLWVYRPHAKRGYQFEPIAGALRLPRIRGRG